MTAPAPVAVEPLPRSILTIWRARSVAVGLALVSGAVVAGLIIEGAWVLGLLVVAGLVLAVVQAVLVELRFRSWRWGLDDRWVEQRSGVVVRRTQLVPRSRVQTLTTRTGPIDRRLGLSSIVVHTAGTHTPNLTIPHLDAAAAERLRAELGGTVDPVSSPTSTAG